MTANTLLRGPSDLVANLMGVQEACVGWIEQPDLMARLMRVCTDVNLVVIEVPYGVGPRHPASATVRALIRELREKKERRQAIEVWIIYPHVLAQTFDLPRQVDVRGKAIDWKWEGSL